MASLSNIDMTDVQELGEGFRIVPPGEYQVYIEASEFKKTKKGDGEYLELVLVVADGDYEGAKIFVRLNLINPNQTTVDIAKSQLRALCEAIVNQPFVNDSAMLHSRPFFALIDNVAMTKSDPNSKRSNEVIFRKGSIRSLHSGAAPGVAAGPVTQVDKPQEAPPAVQQAQAAKTASLPPWKKK